MIEFYTNIGYYIHHCYFIGTRTWLFMLPYKERILQAVPREESYCHVVQDLSFIRLFNIIFSRPNCLVQAVTVFPKIRNLSLKVMRREFCSCIIFQKLSWKTITLLTGKKTSQEKNNQMTDTFASGRNDDKVGVITLHWW